jgi:hypothetical protein
MAGVAGAGDARWPTIAGGQSIAVGADGAMRVVLAVSFEAPSVAETASLTRAKTV